MKERYFMTLPRNITIYALSCTNLTEESIASNRLSEITSKFSDLARGGHS